MAAVPIMIVGTLTGKATKEGDVSATEQVIIHGLASIEGLYVGGGPIIPPPTVPPGKPPHPAFPIAGGPDPGWPDKPGYPDYITGWPIPIPPPGFPEPPPESVVKPPPPEGGWGYHPDFGWGYFPGTGPTPGPKKA